MGKATWCDHTKAALLAKVLLKRLDLRARRGRRRPGRSPVTHTQCDRRTLHQRTQSRKPSSILAFCLHLPIEPTRNCITVPRARSARTLAGRRRRKAFSFQEREAIRIEGSARVTE